MRVSRLFGKTLRDDPSEAEFVSHKLMVKAGFISQVSSGIYSYLPLAWRSLRKIENIIREEMDRIGAQELRLSALQPRELYDESGRTEVFGNDLLTLEDRRGRPLVIAPTHEEVLTNIVKANVSSYKDLPKVLYQIQTKFRDEPRPRGGLIRVREFDMKDAYSFDVDESGLEDTYRSVIAAYERIYSRCGLEVIMVEADSGAMGGGGSHEFIALADSGEDTVLICSECGYAANAEKAIFLKSELTNGSQKPLEEIHTPNIKTINELANYVGIEIQQTLKSVFYMVDGELAVAVIRGDLDINEVKLKNAVNASDIRLAESSEVRNAGLLPGFASPIGQDDLRIIADDSVESSINLVAGANREDYHVLNSNYDRDFSAEVITDISLAKDGYSCSVCESKLYAQRGIELGHVFKLGTKYSASLGAMFLDERDQQHPIIMGSYGIGVGRLLAASIEQKNDDKGMIMSDAIAPYSVWLSALNIEKEEISSEAESLYSELKEEGVEVLFDDREESAGVKFNDADLIGLPVRLVVSLRNLKQCAVEVMSRGTSESKLVPRDDVVDFVKEMIKC